MFDRRIAKRVDDTGEGTFDRAQKFVYDGTQIVLVYDDAGFSHIRRQKLGDPAKETR